MITRRTLLSASLAGAAFAGDRAVACAVPHRVYFPTESDRLRMLAEARRFRALFNRNEIDTLVGAWRSWEFLMTGASISSSNQVAALREFREKRGRILTPVSPDNSMVWPEGARISFICATELRSELDEAGSALLCGAVGGHDLHIFGLGFGIQEGHRWRVDTGAVTLTIGF